jgi:hypothetical protein
MSILSPPSPAPGALADWHPLLWHTHLFIGLISKITLLSLMSASGLPYPSNLIKPEGTRTPTGHPHGTQPRTGARTAIFHSDRHRILTYHEHTRVSRHREHDMSDIIRFETQQPTRDTPLDQQRFVHGFVHLDSWISFVRPCLTGIRLTGPKQTYLVHERLSADPSTSPSVAEARGCERTGPIRRGLACMLRASRARCSCSGDPLDAAPNTRP